jgi:hypothetical protein
VGTTDGPMLAVDEIVILSAKDAHAKMRLEKRRSPRRWNLVLGRSPELATIHVA